jgi:hypothetical protein
MPNRLGEPLLNVTQIIPVTTTVSSAARTPTLVTFIRSIVIFNTSTELSVFPGSLTDADRPKTLHLLRELSLQNPRTLTPMRLELMVASGGSQPCARILLTFDVDLSG